jgi:NDP-sugar pyrophosphorylase family protein
MENTTRLKEVLRYGEAFSKKLVLEPEAKFRYQPRYDDMGNADAVRYCMDYYRIEKDVLVVGGDNIADIALEDFIRDHRSKEAVLTIVLKELEAGEDISQYGVAEIDSEGRITRFVEKPEEEEAPSRFINTALYLFSPKIKEVFKEMGGRVRDIGKDVVPYLTENDYPVYGHITKGYWADVGMPSTYLKTSQDILRQRVANIRFREENRYKDDIWVHPTTIKRIHDKLEKGEIKLGKYTFIGGDCDIAKGVKIESSCIGDNCIIGEGSEIAGSVIMDFTNIGKNVKLNKCIVGRYSTVEDNSIVDADLPVEFGVVEDPTPVIGDNVTILKGSVIGPRKRVASLEESHRILITGKFTELGYDRYNVYFTLK